jgi:N-terminal domain on NACHT_NTPase and P-loop NTPases
MAEAMAVVGFVASIIQLVDFSSKVLERLEEFQADLGDIPRSLRYLKAELPVLQDTLQQTKEAIQAGSVREETKKALIPVIEGCTEQIGLLDTILVKIMPAPTDSRLKRGTKAILSLHQEAKIESIMKILRNYVGTLTFYYVAISSTLQPLTGSALQRVYVTCLLISGLRYKTH